MPTIARVNQGAFGNLVVSANVVTQSIGWTVGSNRFFVLQVAAGSLGASMVSCVATAGVTNFTMTIAATQENFGHASTYLCYLPNASGITSVTTNWTSSNGTPTSLVAAEYSGMSTSATVTLTAVTAEQAFACTTAWTVGTYAGTAGSLLLSGSGQAGNAAAGTFTAGSGWTTVGSYAAANPPQSVMQEQLNISSGTYTGNGIWSIGASCQYYENYIVGFQ